MNWLAHLYLSEANPAVRIGNLLPDLLPLPSLASLPPDFQRGIALHRRIDAFTDAHPTVRQSIKRFAPPFRRFGGVLTDIFYDHFLARDWSAYAAEPLSDFTQTFYASFSQFRNVLPADACARLEQMRAADWLNSYGELSGMARALERIGSRFQRRVDLAGSLSVLESNYELFRSDFQSFFPELQSHVAG
jgi:acyl carrier protein phosphodiesterase